MAVDLTPIDAADQRDIEAFLEINTACRAADIPDFPAPTMREVLGMLRYPRKSSERHRFVARVDERPVGVLDINLPVLDNLHVVNLDILIHPDHRRRGYGRELFEAATAFGRERGRKVVMGMYVAQLAGGAPRDPSFGAFSAAMGAVPALPETRRRLDLDTVDTDSWAPLLADAQSRADGYSTIAWHTDTPDDLIDEVARLEGRMVLDMPLGDLQLEQERYDAQRIRDTEDNMRQRGTRPYQVGIRHDASGTLAAWTMLAFDPDVTIHAFQGTTIVDPAHRGHRLGTVAKIENLNFTRSLEPDVRHVHTWNATENAHMIAINEALGFRPIDEWVNCQLDL